MNPEIISYPETIKAPKTVEELLDEYSLNREKYLKTLEVSLLEFDDLGAGETIGGISGKIELGDAENVALQIDHYNPSKAFQVEGKTVAALRVEPRGSESDSTVKFYELVDNHTGRLIENAPVLKSYQDPFYAGEIQGAKVFGAVKTEERENDISYKTDFFKFHDSLSDLEKFAEGPEGMKDIRLVELPSGGVGVLLRPQGGQDNIYGRGKVGFLEVERLDELSQTLQDFESRAKIYNLFTPDEWGGFNDLYLKNNGKIGLIGHIARFSRDGEGRETNFKEYYATSATFDPETQEISDLKIIMTEEDLEKKLKRNIDHKNASLKSILFIGGSEPKEDGTLICYAGIGDTCAVEFTQLMPIEE